jgi:predicted transcriptional regulator
MLRDARALVYCDAEAFGQAAAILEHIGQIRSGRVYDGLNGYQSVICKLGRQAPEIQSERIEQLFDTVRRARNDSVHSGAYIRHHSIRLVELLLILEEALVMAAKSAADLMVRNPCIAEPWHNIATVRRAMLANSFSNLPVRDSDGTWRLMSDTAIVAYLKAAKNKNERNDLLGSTVEEVIAKKRIVLTDCPRLSPDKTIDEVAKHVKDSPVLIVDEQKHLVGILTAFDLL